MLVLQSTATIHLDGLTLWLGYLCGTCTLVALGLGELAVLAPLLLLWAPHYLYLYTYGSLLRLGLTLFSCIMSLLLSTGTALHLWMAWEALTFISASLVAYTHSSLALSGAHRALLWNAGLQRGSTAMIHTHEC